MLEYDHRASMELVSCSPSQYRSLSARVITFIKTQFSSRNAIGRQWWYFHDGTIKPHMMKYRKCIFSPFSVGDDLHSNLFSNFLSPFQHFHSNETWKNYARLLIDKKIFRHKRLGNWIESAKKFNWKQTHRVYLENFNFSTSFLVKKFFTKTKSNWNAQAQKLVNYCTKQRRIKFF